jgi:hypothetical protein
MHTASDWAIAVASQLLLICLAIGLLLGKRYRYCYAFFIYVIAQLTGNIVTVYFSPFFITWIGWTIKETIYALLRLAIFTEMSILVFRALPRARIRAYVTLLATGAGIMMTLAWLGPIETNYDLGHELTTRFSYLTVWGLMTMLGLVSWYRLPLYRIHKSILHGMVWLLLLRFASFLPADDYLVLAFSVFNVLQLLIFVAWNRAIWAPETVLSAEERLVIRYLQPWRAT